MILTIDVGNTNIVLGGFVENNLTFVSRISTNSHKTDAEYATKIKSILLLNNITETQIDGAIISSVVPPLNNVLKNAVKTVYGIEPLIVGPGIKTGINLQVDNSGQVGSDLICGCVAAHETIGGDTLIIDMGTATKLTLLDSSATFRGVSIIPGVEISLKALSGTAAQLPFISLEAPRHIIAKNTVDCMRSGIVFGSAAMIDGMIEKIADEFGKMPNLIATGGLAKTIISHCSHSIPIDDNLILKGLYLIYEKNK